MSNRAQAEARRKLLWHGSANFIETIKNQNSKLRSAIIPFMIGDEKQGGGTAAALREQGIFVPAIRYPTVARGQARLRVDPDAAHTVAEFAQLVAGVGQIVNRKS